MEAKEFNAILRKIDSDSAAFDKIYNEYVGKMKYAANSILHNDPDVADALQTAFLNLVEYVKSSKYEWIKYPGAFMNTVVKNAALNILRFRGESDSLDADEDVEDRSSDVESYSNCKDIISFIKSLPKTEREIAERLFIYDMPVKVVAAEMNMSVSGVKWYRSNIRKKFREKMK